MGFPVGELAYKSTNQFSRKSHKKLSAQAVSSFMRFLVASSQKFLLNEAFQKNKMCRFLIGCNWVNLLFDETKTKNSKIF